MQILSGAKKTEGDAVWEGGQILDPNNGKTYKVRLKPVEDGRKLEVRGYICPFYRNQVWLRADLAPRRHPHQRTSKRINP